MKAIVIKVRDDEKVRMLVEMLRSMNFIASVELMGTKEVSTLGEISPQHASTKVKLSGKYRGILSKDAGKKLNEHIKQMRSEWNSIL